MDDQRTMVELLRAPTEGYAEAIVVPSILAEQFELKHSGNLLERRTQDVLMIIENKSKIAKLTHAVNQQTSAVTTAMTTILKQFQATPPPAFVKAVEEICVTCSGAHPYYQWNFVYRPPGMANQIRPPGFAQPNVQNNQNRFSQPQVYNRGNNFNPEQSYQALTQQNQVVPLNELEKVKRMNEANMKDMQTQINNVKNKLRNEMKNSIQASMSNQTNELKNIMASFFQMNTASTSGSGSLPSNTVANPKGKLKSITTRSGIVLDGPFVPTVRNKKITTCKLLDKVEGLVLLFYNRLDKSMWSDQKKRVQKIDRVARSFLIQRLPNDIYSLIDSNKTAKDLWDALARHMLGSEYGEQDRKAAVLYEYETFKATEGELLLDTYIRYLQVINDLKKCGYSKDNCELNFKFLNNLQLSGKAEQELNGHQH
nr:hypothetical protein [Tanacetum cinerariifolium]